MVSFTPLPLYPWGAPGTHWRGCWVGPRTGLHDVEKRKFLTLPGLELRPLGRPARSQSLYRLRYSGSYEGFAIVWLYERFCLPVSVEHGVYI
jgi:hypothetical protein